MTKIRDEKELRAKLQEDLGNCGVGKVVLQAGHFPLIYAPEGIVEGVKRWGQFSRYSLELGCRMGEIAREMGKKVEFAFLVDDHSYEPENGCKMVRSKFRDRFYRKKSGPEARLNPEYQRIMAEYGFDERDVLRHDQERAGRQDCLYFSEKILRSSKRQIEH